MGLRCATFPQAGLRMTPTPVFSIFLLSAGLRQGSFGPARRAFWARPFREDFHTKRRGCPIAVAYLARKSKNFNRRGAETRRFRRNFTQGFFEPLNTQNTRKVGLWTFLELTPFGRRENREDSPAGWCKLRLMHEAPAR